jgi:hypothetical protein
MLPIAAHRWVSTDNTFWHARWDNIDYFIDFTDYIDYCVNYIDYSSDYFDCIIFFGFIDFRCQDTGREPDYF